MRPLHLVPPLGADEPIQSFASRVARRHGVDMPTLCSEVGLSCRGLVAGEGESVRRLSDLTGVDAQTLSRRAFRPSGGTWLYGDQVLHRTSVRRIALAVCPVCLLEDVAAAGDPRDQAAYVRAHWLVRAVRACPTHGVALVAMPDEGATLFGDRYHDLAARIAPAVSRLDELVGGVRPDAATRLEAWVVACMVGGGRPSLDFLDAMPLHAATRSCEMLGVAALFGPHAPLRSLADADWRAAGEVGFDVASLGAGAVASCLAGLMDAHGVATRNLGPAKVFGSLYRWLRSAESGPPHEPLRAVLRQVVLDTIPLPAGTEVLGVTLAERRVHSLRSAGIETGQGTKGMRRALRASGVLPATGGKGPGRLVPIGVEQAEAARAEAADSVPRIEAASILGATIGDVKRLAAAGLLGAAPAPRRRAREHRRFSRRELARFLGRLSCGVTGVQPAAAEACDIPTAAFRTHRGLAAITAMVSEGRLRSVTSPGDEVGFRAIRVDAAEILGVAGHDRPAGRVIDDVASELRVTRATALALVREGHLAATRVPSAVSRGSKLVVEGPDLAAFASRFASLSTLAWREGASVNTVKARLDASGVVPAFPGRKTRSAIYRVADLDATGETVEVRPRRRPPPGAGPRGSPREAVGPRRTPVADGDAARGRRRR